MDLKSLPAILGPSKWEEVGDIRKTTWGYLPKGSFSDWFAYCNLRATRNKAPSREGALFVRTGVRSGWSYMLPYFLLHSLSNSSTVSSNMSMALMIGAGVSRSTPALRRISSGGALDPAFSMLSM